MIWNQVSHYRGCVRLTDRCYQQSRVVFILLLIVSALRNVSVFPHQTALQILIVGYVESLLLHSAWNGTQKTEHPLTFKLHVRHYDLARNYYRFPPEYKTCAQRKHPFMTFA